MSHEDVELTRAYFEEIGRASREDFDTRGNSELGDRLRRERQPDADDEHG
jgi:hypothetical protein